MANCKICASSDLCLTCKTNYSLAFYDTACIACNQPCLTCDTPLSCTSCLTGYYVTSLKSCSKCIANCLQCTNTFDCSKCDVGYYFNGNY